MIITLTNGGDTVCEGYFYRELLNISKRINIRGSLNFVENIVLCDV